MVRLDLIASNCEIASESTLDTGVSDHMLLIAIIQGHTEYDPVNIEPSRDEVQRALRLKSGEYDWEKI